jgi:hypothetical protein
VTIFSSPGVYVWVRTEGGVKAPLMGLLKLDPFSFPGVNAWATEKSFKLGHHRQPGSLPAQKILSYVLHGVVERVAGIARHEVEFPPRLIVIEVPEVLGHLYRVGFQW